MSDEGEGDMELKVENGDSILVTSNVLNIRTV